MKKLIIFGAVLLIMVGVYFFFSGGNAVIDVLISKNPTSKLERIENNRQNRAPVALLESNKKAGSAPLTVHFIGGKSVDYDGDELRYSWSFGQDRVQSTEVNPTYTFETPGVYQVQLTVTDSKGKRTMAQTEIVVKD